LETEARSKTELRRDGGGGAGNGILLEWASDVRDPTAKPKGRVSGDD